MTRRERDAFEFVFAMLAGLGAAHVIERLVRIVL